MHYFFLFLPPNPIECLSHKFDNYVPLPWRFYILYLVKISLEVLDKLFKCLRVLTNTKQWITEWKPWIEKNIWIKKTGKEWNYKEGCTIPLYHTLSIKYPCSYFIWPTTNQIPICHNEELSEYCRKRSKFTPIIWNVKKLSIKTKLCSLFAIFMHHGYLNRKNEERVGFFNEKVKFGLTRAQTMHPCPTACDAVNCMH